MNDDKTVKQDPFLNITHEVIWEEDSTHPNGAMARIAVVLKVNGESLGSKQVLASVSGDQASRIDQATHRLTG